MRLIRLILTLITITSIISFSGCINDNNTTNTITKPSETPTNTGVINQNTHKTVSTNPDDYKSWVPANAKVKYASAVNYLKGHVIVGEGSTSTMSVKFPCINKDGESIVIDNDAYWMDLTKEHNITDAYNKTKYAKQYEQLLDFLVENRKWEDENLHGKTVVNVVLYDNGKPYFSVLYDGGRDLEEDLVKMGRAYLTKDQYELMIKNSKLHNLTREIEKTEKLWALQEEAKKNKVGIWSIDFNN
jgi:hypothetical protein